MAGTPNDLAVIAAEYDSLSTSLLIMPLLFFHFIFDTTFTFFRRLSSGRNVIRAHRGHLYQLMNQMGATHFRVSVFHFAITVAQGIGALVLIQIESEHRILVFAPFLAFQTIYATVVVRMSRARGLLDNG